MAAMMGCWGRCSEERVLWSLITSLLQISESKTSTTAFLSLLKGESTASSSLLYESVNREDSSDILILYLIILLSS